MPEDLQPRILQYSFPVPDGCVRGHLFKGCLKYKFSVRAAVQVHTLSAAVHTVFIYDSCSVGTDTTSCTLLTSAHDMVAVIADNETTENIIVLFPALDVDFEKSLHIKEKVTVDDSRTIIFIVTKLTDVFRICEHIFETGSRNEQVRTHSPCTGVSCSSFQSCGSIGR